MANATIRVQFGNAGTSGERSGHLSAEIDSRPDGLNGGRTGFAPGETVFILVYASDNVSVTDTICSAGSLSPRGETVVTLTDELMFEDADTASLKVPALGSLGAITWYGRSLGNLMLGSDRLSVKASTKGVGVAKVSYNARAQIYALASPFSLNGETDFSILAIIKGAVQ